MTLKRLFAQWRSSPLAAAALFLWLCGSASGQIIVTDYFTLYAAVQTSTVITNFASNSIITLTNASQTLEITTNVLIDGTSNNIVIDGGSAARLFHVHPNCQLTLNNLQLLNGVSTRGAAIFNEGTVIISNCIVSGNAATNVSGASGSANTSGGNGGSAGSGASAIGGAIYSTGPVFVYYSVFGTNSAFAGEGGVGGDGGAQLFFGGNGGNGGNGGSASGAAIYSSGSNNVFFADEFINNACLAGSGGGGGNAGAGGIDGGNTGQGGSGGSAQGGALCISGNLSISNCLFYLNTATAGASAGAQVLFDGDGSDGAAGGSATGGGLYVSAVAGHADIENTVFFNNSCVGGAGGGASGQSANGGNGGSAIGGGLDSSAAHAMLVSCTLATNTLTGGTNGTGSGGSGSFGATAGWDVAVSGGALRLSDSILSGGTYPGLNYKPNAAGVIDAGYNVCSDSSLARPTSTTILDVDPGLGSAIVADGGPGLGPAGIVAPAMLTLAITNGPAAQLVPGVAGVTFPATDERLQPRGSPTSAGAFEFAPITLSSNISLPTITLQPVGLNTGVGSTATFTVSADETATNGAPQTLGYQWQLNGTNLIDSSTFHGVNTTNLTVKGVNLADQGPYQVVVGVSTLEGVVTSAVARLVVVAPPKITVQPTRKLNEPDGAIVNFKVTATGAEPLYFQWRNGSQNLSDGDEISGSMTSNLVINPATSIDKGTYSVVVSNAYGSVASIAVPLTVVADKVRPTVAITSPAVNARTTTPVISGKATDNAQVTNVYWWITNINAGVIAVISGSVALDTNGTTTRTWAITNTVAPGTNIVAVRGIDYSGNFSLVVTRKFFLIVPSVFGLAINGTGTVKGSASVAGNVAPANGAMLNIGEGYTVTETPGHNYAFANWTLDGVASYSPKLHFIMEPGLDVAAYFTAKPAVHTAETYNGLFYDQTNGISEQTAGMLRDLTVTSTGAYSGKLVLNGGSYSLSGSFDASDNSANLVDRSDAKGGPVKVQMLLQSAIGQISGVVSGTAAKPWASSLFAEAAAPTGSNGGYRLRLIPVARSDASLADGSLSLTDNFGQLVWSGALGDGAGVSQSVQLGRLGDVPLFSSLYGNTGLILGWINLSNGTIRAGAPLNWIKSRSTSGPFADGFTNSLSVVSDAPTNQISGKASIEFTH